MAAVVLLMFILLFQLGAPADLEISSKLRFYTVKSLTMSYCSLLAKLIRVVPLLRDHLFCKTSLTGKKCTYIYMSQTINSPSSETTTFETTFRLPLKVVSQEVLLCSSLRRIVATCHNYSIFPYTST